MTNLLPPGIRALILDMDGVLWRSSQPLGDLPALFERMRALGLRVALATNNATATAGQYLEKLARFGVTLELWQVINSSEALAYALSRQHPAGGPVYLIGEEGLRQALAQRGFSHSEDGQPLAVTVGLDRGITFEKLRRATLLIRAGVPFWGTNPDRTFPAPEGLIPGAGALLAAIQAATDVKPFIAGKPQRAMFDLALERLGTTVAETLMVGDRLETDIGGAQALGMPTALVLSGVSTREDMERWPRPVTVVAKDLTELLFG